MEFAFNQNENCYEVKEFNQIVTDCRNFIARIAKTDVIIMNENDKKVVAKSRTEIRKKLKEISDLRKELNKIVMGKFNEQSKELERMLADTDAILKAKIDAYKELTAPKEPTIYEITIKSGSKDQLEKVIKKLEKVSDIVITKNFE